MCGACPERETPRRGENGHLAGAARVACLGLRPIRVRPIVAGGGRDAGTAGPCVRCRALTVSRAAILTPLAIASLALVAAPAAGIEPAGTPKPSRDAPGDKPGRGSPLGSEGGKALQTESDAQREAALRHPVVERIEITGNDRVSASSIRDRLAFHEGEVLTPDAVLVSRARLVQLGTFSRVDVDTAPGTRPDAVIVRVAVGERGPITVTDLMIGRTAVTPVYGGLGISVPDA